ncbi:hypothetical protein MXB_3825 [Myxobolus squamalis]|nr:hypothetical protein MXB_3825 [Myxobolus squamalis]
MSSTTTNQCHYLSINSKKVEVLEDCNAKIAHERDDLMAETCDLTGSLYEMENADLKRMIQTKATVDE